MPLGTECNRTDLNTTGISYRNGFRVTLPHEFGTPITLPHEFGTVLGHDFFSEFPDAGSWPPAAPWIVVGANVGTWTVPNNIQLVNGDDYYAEYDETISANGGSIGLTVAAASGGVGLYFAFPSNIQTFTVGWDAYWDSAGLTIYDANGNPIASDPGMFSSGTIVFSVTKQGTGNLLNVFNNGVLVLSFVDATPIDLSTLKPGVDLYYDGNLDFGSLFVYLNGSIDFGNPVTWPTPDPAHFGNIIPDTRNALIAQTGWSLLFVDSEQTPQYAAVLAFDGDPNTFWHSEFIPNNVPLPHEIQIDLGDSYVISGFTYLPRQDGGSNGNITNYDFYTSTDGVTWGTPKSTGVLCTAPIANDTLKTVRFTAVVGRYVRLVAVGSTDGTNAACAELNVFGYY